MFTVCVADNFHYMALDEAYTLGAFATWSEAVAAARAVVDRSLAELFRPGMSADELHDLYRAFGDDPYIVPTPEGERFSAWDYARERGAALCAANGDKPLADGARQL